MANALSLPAGLMIFCVCSAPAYGDNIYQCASKDGAEVLQNEPCQAGSEVWVQKDAGQAQSAPLAPGAAQAATRSAPAANAASSYGAAMDGQEAQGPMTAAEAAPTDTAAADNRTPANLPSEPALGMTQQQVRAILGLPTAIAQEEASQGIEVTWIYGDSRVLQFDAAGRLSKK
jgi:hypothetical protein